MTDRMDVDVKHECPECGEYSLIIDNGQVTCGNCDADLGTVAEVSERGVKAAKSKLATGMAKKALRNAIKGRKSIKLR